MPNKRKKPEDRSTQLLCVTSRTKNRVLDLREGGDRHEEVVVRLLEYWDKENMDNENKRKVSR